MTISPVVKWVGGKGKILSELFKHFPSEINNYFEPFLGGGSVLIEFLKRVKEGKIVLNGKIYASDSNESLIEMYQSIQSNPTELISELKLITKEFDILNVSSKEERNVKCLTEINSAEAYYYYIRHLYNSSVTSTVKKSAMFIYLNKTGFRGLHRVGPSGFNVPFGNYKSPSVYDECNITELSALIQNVVFETKDYSQISPMSNDFVYLDPPYVLTFTKYNSKDFKEEHIKLFKMVKSFSCFLMNNSDTELVRNCFEDFQIDTISCRRAINSKDPSSKANELLVYPR